MKKIKLFGIVLVILSMIICLPACGQVEPPVPEKPEEPVRMGWITGKVVLDDNSIGVCGIIVEDAKGARTRTTTDLLAGYRLELAPGEYKLTFTHGPEYTAVERTVTVKSLVNAKQENVKLERLTDYYGNGWLAGDLHMHTTYSDGGDSVFQQLLSNMSQGLYFGFLTDHNTAEGLLQWTTGNGFSAYKEQNGQDRPFRAFPAVEITTQFGHYQALGTDLVLGTDIINISADEKKLTGEEYDQAIKNKLITIAEEIRLAGGVPQINHPYSTRDMGFNYWDVADYYDTIEIWNGVFVPCDGRYESSDPNSYEQNYRSKLKWFELLNTVRDGGKFHAATGGTDNHSTTAPYTPYGDIREITDMATYNEAFRRNGIYSGVPTTYVYCPGAQTQKAVLDALVAGHSFVTNGVLVSADIKGASFGDKVKAASQLTLNTDIFCRDGLEKLVIVKNGEVYKEIALDNLQQYNQPVELAGMEAGDWIVLEVFGTETRYAITNPIFFGK